MENGTPHRQKKLQETLERDFISDLIRLPDLAWKEFGLSYSLSRRKSLEVFEKLKSHQHLQFNMLIDITAVDWMDRREPRFDVIYHLLSITYLHRVCIRVSATEDDAKVPSVRSLWPAANFLEREVWDMYGIQFEGHGDLRRILMYEEFVGYPLRKDYPLRGKQPRVPLRIPELRNTSADMQREQLVALPTKKKKPEEESGVHG